MLPSSMVGIEAENTGQGLGESRAGSQRKAQGKTPWCGILKYMSLSLRQICFIKLKPSSGEILLFAVKPGEADL